MTSDDAGQRWPDVHLLGSGSVTAEVAADGGLREIRSNTVPVIHRLFSAVRDLDWSTLTSTGARVDTDAGPDGVRVSVAERLGGVIDSTTVVEIGPPGRISASAELLVLSPCRINRWGLNLCLGARCYMGARVKVGGRGLHHRLPHRVAPQLSRDGVLQGLFPPDFRLAIERLDGLRLELSSEGLDLELEDQRNWTDASYKIYSGSLQTPLPIALSAGDRLAQALTMTWAAPSESRRTARSTWHGAVSGSPAWGSAVDLPRIGTQVNDAADEHHDGTKVAEALGVLAVDHVRFDLEPGATSRGLPSWTRGLPLEVAMLIDERELDQVAGTPIEWSQLPAGSRMLVHLAGRRNSDRALADHVRRVMPHAASIPTVAGTDVYFADLNRDPPDVAGGLVSFSMIPSAHFDDLQAVFETLPMQALAVAQARESLRAGVVVSPITLRLRGDPEGRPFDRSARRMIAPQHIDERLEELPLGAWTLGSVCAVTIAGAVSGTWHELAGPRGILTGEVEHPSYSPAFHALAVLGASSRPRVRPLRGSSDFAGLAFPDQSRAVMCSLRPWRQRLEPASHLVPSVGAVTRRRLRDEDVAQASTTADWWHRPPEPIDDRAVLELEPFEITELSWSR